MMKRGGWAIGQIAKLILAVAVVIILLMLVARLFVPFFDKGDETAKSYFETFKDEIKVADKGEVAEFFMWYLGDSDREYYLVYFGKTIEVDFVKMRRNPNYGMVGPSGIPISSGPEYYSIDVQFNSFGADDNKICICTVKDYESTCKYCDDLKHPVKFEGKGDIWYEESGERISIKLDGDRYVFSEIK